MPIYYDKKRKTYYVSVYVEMKDGTKKRIMRRGFKGQREAKKAENDIIFEYAQKSSDNPQMDELCDEYYEWATKRRKKSTLYKIEYMLRLHLKPFFKNKKVQNIVNKDIMNFHDYLLDFLSPSTAKTIHKQLSAMLNYSIKMGYISANICNEVGNIDIKDVRKIDYWTLEEFKSFMPHVDNLKYKALFMTLFYSGARIGELLGLTWSDINFDNNSININKRFYRGDIDTTKTGASTRVIAMPHHTMNLLRELKLSLDAQPVFYVFGKHNDPLYPTTVWAYYLKTLDKSGVRRIRLHDFRHSHTAYLINKGTDIQIVSKRLGHEKVSTTYDIYAHLYPDKEVEAVLNMEDDFKQADVIQLFKN